MTIELRELEERLDRVAMELLPPLRARKILDGERVLDLLNLADQFHATIGDADLVPRKLTSKLWHIFAELIMQAEYGPNSAQILDVAWQYHERLQDIFGSPLIWDGAAMPDD